MSQYSEFFLVSASNKVQYETLEISHSEFSQTYYLVRNHKGLVATDENSNSRTWTYVPMRIEPSGAEVNLDFGITVTLGDLGEIMPAELDRIKAGDDMDERPVVIYRTFEEGTLTAPMTGPFTLEVMEFSFNHEGVVLQCRPAFVNRNQTGMPYIPELFPTLEGFR